MLDIGLVLMSTGVTNYPGGNPFATGNMRLVQSGSDTLVQIDLDGSANGENYTTFATLQGVTASQLTAANLGGYEPGTIITPNSPPSAPADSDTAGGDTLQENAAAGAYTGVTLASTDAEGNTVTFALTDDAGGRFTIDSSGRIVATGTVPLDFETASVDGSGNHYYDVTGQASDGTDASGTTTFRIYVTNQVEHLFTSGGDGTLASPIDFNSLSDGAYDFDGARYAGLDGEDFVVLPNTGTVDAGNPWDFAQVFDGGAGNDMIQGGDGNDRISGGDGIDRLFGDGGDDALNGGAAIDILIGGSGTDSLTGGGGSDVFVFTQSELGTTSAGAHDVITDFQPGADWIDVSALYASHAVSSIKHGKASDAATLSGYKIEYYSMDGKTFIIGDTDGVAGADFTIELNGTPKLKSADFITSASEWPVGTNGYDYASLHQDAYWI